MEEEMKTLHAMFGLPDSIGLNGMFSQKSTEWVLQDKIEPEEEDVFLASVGPFKTEPIFRHHRNQAVKNDWVYLWEVVMSERIGFSVHLTAAKDGTYVLGAKGKI
jgi:hypothetical protein